MVTLVSIQIGQPETYFNPEGNAGKPWTSAIFKRPVLGPVQVNPTNLEGDQQADRRVHGGPDKAVLAYSGDHYAEWRDELGLPEMGAGGFGENLTFSGLTEESVCIGDLWRIGEVRLQVAQPRQPCWKLARRWERIELPKLVARNGRTGWYLRVLHTGAIEAGQECRLEDRPHPAWPVSRANRALFDKSFPSDEGWELAELPELANSWRNDLVKRLPPRGTQTLFE